MTPAYPEITSETEWPRVSIIIPCRNEARHIGPCLESVLSSDYDRERLEIVIADGMSDDGTRERIAEFTSRYPQITMVDNPKRITPTALNAAIRVANGEIIVRMDAHAMYPSDYVSRLVSALRETGADNVGGTWITLPGDQTATAEAIAIALSHPLGVGNSHHRVGTAARRWVNHVPFGCWRKTVFDQLGLFDEDLPRDQDVEFDLRLLRSGGRILLIPEVTTRYHARRTIRQLVRMLYQYAYYKPLVARKVGRVMTVRQVVPSLFLVVLLSAGLLSFISPLALFVFAGIAGLYSALVSACAWQGGRRRGWRCGAVLLAVFPLMHLGYAAGYLRGLVDHFVLSRRRIQPPSLTR